MYRGKKTHKTQRKHTYVTGLPQLLGKSFGPVQQTCHVPHLWYSLHWLSFTFPPASHRSIVIYPLHQKPALPLAFHRSISQRYVTHGNLGLRSSSSTTEAQNLPLSAHGLKYLPGRCMHPSCRLVPQVLHSIFWASTEKAHPLHEEAVTSHRNWVTTAGHFVFFNAVLKLGHRDTEQISSSDKGTEQNPSFNHSIEITSDLEPIQV